MGQANTLLVQPILEKIAAGAAQADLSRTVDDSVIQAIKGNPVMAMTASEELQGSNAGAWAVACELEAVAAACGSTASA